MKTSLLTIVKLLLIGLLLSVASVHAATQERPDEQLRIILKKAVEDSTSFADRYAAEVWLVDMSHRLRHYIKQPDRRLKLLRLVHQEATRAGLHPELVLAVIHVESRFDRFAISRVGARGLMQVMPFWLDEIGHPEDNLFDVQTNLRFGCTILRYYLDMEKGNLQRALARYNGSTGKVWYPNKVFKALHTRWYKR